MLVVWTIKTTEGVKMLIIKKEYEQEIIKHAKEDSPFEACGILAGKKHQINKIYKMANKADNPGEFYFMEPAEQFKVIKEIRKEGLEMLGIYHSHPYSPAYPSKYDVELAFYPEAVYVIVSLKDLESPEIKGFKITDGKIINEDISI